MTSIGQLHADFHGFITLRNIFEFKQLAIELSLRSEFVIRNFESLDGIAIGRDSHIALAALDLQLEDIVQLAKITRRTRHRVAERHASLSSRCDCLRKVVAQESTCSGLHKAHAQRS